MLDKLYMLNCFKCCIKFEDIYMINSRSVLYAENHSVLNVMEIINIIMSSQIMKPFKILSRKKQIHYIHLWVGIIGMNVLKSTKIL